jgi:hypothetical protein
MRKTYLPSVTERTVGVYLQEIYLTNVEIYRMVIVRDRPNANTDSGRLPIYSNRKT